jgi:hypothetical protein
MIISCGADTACLAAHTRRHTGRAEIFMDASHIFIYSSVLCVGAAAAAALTFIINPGREKISS